MRELIVKQLGYDLTPVAGLALVGHYLKRLAPAFKQIDTAWPIKGGVANSDILRSYMHLNAVENLAPFAAVVLIAQAPGASSATTEICAAVYFCARLAHAVLHISGFGLFMARTVAFTVAWVAFITFAVALLQSAM